MLALPLLRTDSLKLADLAAVQTLLDAHHLHKLILNQERLHLQQVKYVILVLLLHVILFINGQQIIYWLLICETDDFPDDLLDIFNEQLHHLSHKSVVVVRHEVAQD